MIDPVKLEEVRKRRGKAFNQGAVAKRLGISQSNYSTKLKTGEFTDQEVMAICEFLGIKKEQIEVSSDLSVSDLTLITNKIIQIESALKVTLSTQAEILAKLTSGNATKIRTDLESVVDSLSRQALERLGHQV